MPKPPVPEIDEELRLRLGRRFGSAIEPWLEALPVVLAELAERWELEWGALIRRGSMSAVVRCLAAGRPAVLKASPDRERIAHEAAALARWRTAHVPAVLAVDERGRRPADRGDRAGDALVEMPAYPDLESLVSLMRSLHESGAPDAAYRACRRADRPPLRLRLEELRAATRSRRGSIPLECTSVGAALAMRLAAEPTPTVLLHGDLTPVNVLDGGPERGLVRRSTRRPASATRTSTRSTSCSGAPTTSETITARAEQLATDAGRALDWCIAFAAMVALELAEAPLRRPSGERVVEAELRLDGVSVRLPPRLGHCRLRSGKSSSRNSAARRSPCSSCVRSSTRRILPQIVFGSSANSSRRTRLYGARCSRA